ncbi:LamG-like jellyroll fold domain-containing protein [Allorhodopirellula solitaria]|uniref:LamG-like jellyroll fold domain-containing protein n=1 Tax=Allorhodopirellula solitaria TaxID=2527987 RepID=A0A5C5WLK3_9BACT|nr:exo-alpha-sialidase [Allorhodopirellula solitaria]TWT51664.1 hypothetical protein CA85_52240 [Allorhodopirellula solitaria]
MIHRFAYPIGLVLFASALAVAAEPHPDRLWPLDSTSSESLRHKGGSPSEAVGVHNQALVLDGASLLEVDDVAATPISSKPFSLVVWVNPYNLNRGQQMIAAKNRYALNEREWGIMIDHDEKLRLYVQQDGWRTADADAAFEPGTWHQVGLVVAEEKAELYLDGQLAGTIELTQPIAQTNAPLTFGGVDDNGRIRQTLMGALDHAMLFNRSLMPSEMAALYRPVTATHSLPEHAEPFRLWDEALPIPVAAKISTLKDVKFHVIKKWDREADGYTFLHGVGLGWHKNKLYASIGHNKGAENTVSEEAQYRVSDDEGRTWSELRVIDAGEEPGLAVSHGVFLSHANKLWAFHGAYYGKMEEVHTRAYAFDETAGKWREQGIVVRNGFWPMNQPVKMHDGNWIMPGISAGPYSNNHIFPAAVAISRGDDFTQWDYVEIPGGAGISRMWGESANIVSGKRILNVARFGGGTSALVAVSEDYGRTWTPSRTSNLPMATSKPVAGVLSTGQRFLICTTAKNNGGKRTPLTIAVTAPGEDLFHKVFVIRRSRHPNQPGESAGSLSLSYPCAIEMDGSLYVGYSNNGGRRGNLNSAELAIIPLTSLQ